MIICTLKENNNYKAENGTIWTTEGVQLATLVKENVYTYRVTKIYATVIPFGYVNYMISNEKMDRSLFPSSFNWKRCHELYESLMKRFKLVNIAMYFIINNCDIRKMWTRNVHLPLS